MFSSIDSGYMERLEPVVGRKLTEPEWEEVVMVMLDYADELEHGDEAFRAQQYEQRRKRLTYFAYLLRDDFHRAYMDNSYPRPRSERMKKIWPLAKYLYMLDDPSGFLGPSLSEFEYVLRAIQSAYLLGNDDFLDVLSKANPHFGRYDLDEHGIHVPENDAEYQAWIDNNGAITMFDLRRHRPLENGK